MIPEWIHSSGVSPPQSESSRAVPGCSVEWAPRIARRWDLLSFSRIGTPLHAGTLLGLTANTSMYSSRMPINVSFSVGLSCPPRGLRSESLRFHPLCCIAPVVSFCHCFDFSFGFSFLGLFTVYEFDYPVRFRFLLSIAFFFSDLFCFILLCLFRFCFVLSLYIFYPVCLCLWLWLCFVLCFVLFCFVLGCFSL